MIAHFPLEIVIWYLNIKIAKWLTRNSLDNFLDIVNTVLSDPLFNPHQVYNMRKVKSKWKLFFIMAEEEIG